MPENKIKPCQSCKNSFIIEPEDFAFYEKIRVPAPTFCPECRLIRRLCFMNERSFYKRKCDLCHRDVISILPRDTPQPVYCPSCWWSDKWDPMAYGRSIDFSKPFLAQLLELRQSVPEISLQTIETSMVESNYCNICSYLKNCYLVFNSDYNEDCAYSTYLERSKRSYELTMSDLCELCYESRNLHKDYRVVFSANCNECMDVAFSRNLIDCSNCFGCINLRHKKYHIFNVPYSKEDYTREIAKYDTGSYRTCLEVLRRVELLSLQLPKKFMEGLHNVNVSGDYIFDSKNTFYSYEVGGGEDCKYCAFLFIAPTKDSYDFTAWGGGAEQMYECMGAGGGQRSIKFAHETWTQATNLTYCWYILAKGDDLFGCGALKNKQYCILNKQYTKAEYEDLIPKVIRHMQEVPYTDAKGRVYRYGEFFPPEFSLFGYNESLAQSYFPLIKEKALERGFKWKDAEERNIKIQISNDKLPDHIRDVSDDIINRVIGCGHAGTCNEQCTTAFKIIPQELAFYRKMNLPLPRLCPNCRHYQRLKQGNPLKLWKRSCQCAGVSSESGVYKNTATHRHGENHCPNEFETSYAPERPEIVYCEQCYNAEVA